MTYPRPLFDPEPYELPAVADCIVCDGRGWFDALGPTGIVDVRCECWRERLALEGPPE